MMLADQLCRPAERDHRADAAFRQPPHSGAGRPTTRASGLDLRPSGPLLGRALALARRLRHPVYDCLYLALAQAEGATLITADRRLLARVARGRARVAVVDLATL